MDCPRLHKLLKAEKPLMVESQPEGRNIVGKSILLEDYLRERQEAEAFDGPLTDYECSDLEDGERSEAGDVDDSSARVEHSEGSAAPFPLNKKDHEERRRQLKKRERKDQSKKRRNKRGREEQLREEQDMKPAAKRHRGLAAKNALKFSVDFDEDIEATGPGWIGPRQNKLPKRSFTAAELTETYGMKVFSWDGRTPHVLLDAQRRVIGALVGQPRDPSWKAVHDRVFKKLHRLATTMQFTEKEQSHRRGSFPAVAHGLSYGGGQQVPQHLRHSSEQKEKALDDLMGDADVQRVCNFGSCAFKMYSERNYENMAATVEALRADCDSLRRPYDQYIGVFPCRSINLGQQSVSFPHTDEGNLAQSWCSITPFGDFDPKIGAHLVLWDFGLIIEFPPGATIMIPSALLTHSNTPILPGETRYSLIQYAAGGLFRWVRNGFKTQFEWQKGAEPEELLNRIDEDKDRWKEAVKMFTKFEELVGLGSGASGA